MLPTNRSIENGAAEVGKKGGVGENNNNNKPQRLRTSKRFAGRVLSSEPPIPPSNTQAIQGIQGRNGGKNGERFSSAPYPQRHEVEKRCPTPYSPTSIGETSTSKGKRTLSKHKIIRGGGGKNAKTSVTETANVRIKSPKTLDLQPRQGQLNFSERVENLSTAQPHPSSPADARGQITRIKGDDFAHCPLPTGLDDSLLTLRNFRQGLHTLKQDFSGFREERQTLMAGLVAQSRRLLLASRSVKRSAIPQTDQSPPPANVKRRSYSWPRTPFPLQEVPLPEQKKWGSTPNGWKPQTLVSAPPSSPPLNRNPKTPIPSGLKGIVAEFGCRQGEKVIEGADAFYGYLDGDGKQRNQQISPSTPQPFNCENLNTPMTSVSSKPPHRDNGKSQFNEPAQQTTETIFSEQRSLLIRPRMGKFVQSGFSKIVYWSVICQTEQPASESVLQTKSSSELLEDNREQSVSAEMHKMQSETPTEAQTSSTPSQESSHSTTLFQTVGGGSDHPGDPEDRIGQVLTGIQPSPVIAGLWKSTSDLSAPDLQNEAPASKQAKLGKWRSLQLGFKKFWEQVISCFWRRKTIENVTTSNRNDLGKKNTGQDFINNVKVENLGEEPNGHIRKPESTLHPILGKDDTEHQMIANLAETLSLGQALERKKAELQKREEEVSRREKELNERLIEFEESRMHLAAVAGQIQARQEAIMRDQRENDKNRIVVNQSPIKIG